MEIVEFLGTALAYVGLASPLLIFALVDRYIRDDLKVTFASHVFGTPSQSISDRVSLFHNTILSRALGKGFRTRLTRLVAIGAVSIFFVYSLQYFYHREAFDENTWPFIAAAMALHPFALYVMAAFLTVDAISFFQTITFARLAAYCKNPIEVLFLAFADIVVSLFLVIIILPVLIFAAHKFAEGPRPATIRIALDDVGNPQTVSTRDILTMAAPILEDSEDDLQDGVDTLKQVIDDGWIYSAPRMYLAPATESVSLDRVANGKVRSVGGTIIFEKGRSSASQTGEALAELIRTDASIKEARLLESYRDPFGRSIYTFEISGQSSASKLSLFKDYRFLMRDVNFFGNDFNQALQLGSKVYRENEIMWLGMVGNAIDSVTGSVVYKCDNGTLKSVDRLKFLVEAADGCSNGVAMSATGVAGIAAMLSYKFEEETVIPILPTALSSIFLTVMIYFSIIVWICLPYIRVALERYAVGGATLLKDNFFTITFVVVVLLSLPLVAAIW
ncbi:hypothetical protein [Rhizobium leguminosarum]|uniref:hypothetical protein n=1 Tax=Rhizobium leguminosarum TaxID=384 RepID=UPI003F9B9A19